jgi:hypothetical protein
MTWLLDHNIAQKDHVDKIWKKICIQGVLGRNEHNKGYHEPISNEIII